MVAAAAHIIGGRPIVEHDPARAHLELMRKVALERDREAFRELFVYYAPRVKAQLLRQRASTELAEDLMQETMLTLWNKAEQFTNRRGSLGGWIFTIARNKRIDRIRRLNAAHYVAVEEHDLADDAPDAEDQTMAGERDRKVAAVVRALPADQREVIELAFNEDLSQSEIAERLGIPLGTVKSRTRLAFQKMRRELEDAL
jgi:RNA polymerase sigma-70 factor (ECF subfamily)